MEMKQIIKELEEKLREEQEQVKDLEKKMNFWKAAVEDAEKNLKTRRDNVSSLEMMIEAAKEGHFGLAVKTVTAETVKKTETETEAKEAKEVKKETKEAKKDNKNLEWKYENAFIVKINEYDNIQDRWRTQRAAAKSLGWSQSGVSQFMKLNRDTQIRRKGFALIWEY